MSERSVTITLPLKDAVYAMTAIQEMCNQEASKADVERKNGNGDLARHIGRNIDHANKIIQAVKDAIA